jgi:glycosyltransferase
MARRKILFCDNSLRELLNFRKEIICHYASNGYDVVLVAPQNMDIYQWELPNIRFVPVIMNRSGTNPIEDLKYFFRLKRIYAKEKPDYIFHYTIKPNIYGTFAARSCGIRSSAMIAGLGYVFSRKNIPNWIARYLYKTALRYSEYVLVLNKSNRDFLIDKKIASREKIILLSGGEGVNLNHFQIK